MSAAGSQGPDALGPQQYSGFQPSTPSSTVHDDYPGGGGGGGDKAPPPGPPSATGLPPFSSFSADTDSRGDTQYTSLENAHWESYYTEGLSGRLLERDLPMMVPQPQYRPWESKPLMDEKHVNNGYDGYPPSPKLPSFQSQFNAFPQDAIGPNGEPVAALTPLAPVPAVTGGTPPSPSSSGLPSFHTLSAVPVPMAVARGYPLVPAPVPVQAREVPAIQQQILEERHIHLAFGGVPPPAPLQQFHAPIIKSEPVTIVTSTPPQLTQLHHTNFQNPMSILETTKDENGLKFDEANGLRKKERRKVRASSLESSTESDGAGSSSLESSGQVAAVSSTAGFKSPMQVSGASGPAPGGAGSDDGESSSGEKPVKKKRKRCGECIGCQRKDNCGDCAPCRNEKSHQICKMRRCEKLTEKKHLLAYLSNPDGTGFSRGEQRRGRGKARTPGYRNKTGRHTHTPQPTQPSPSQQQQQQQQQQNLSDTVTMISNVPDQTPPIMPFYGSTGQPGAQMMEPVGGGFGAPLRDRFGASWPPPPQPGDAAAINGLTTWGPAPPQTQFIQQVPPHHPPHHPHHPHQLDELRYHPQYASSPSYHQTTGYQQAFLVDPNQQAQSAFQQQSQLYPNPNNRPPSSPAQQPLTPRSNYSQTHTPQPSPTQHQVNGVNGNVPQRNGLNGQYLDSSSGHSSSGQPMEYVNGSYNPSQDGSMAPPPSTTPTSRSSSVHMDTGGGGGGGGDSNGNLNGNGPHAGMNGGTKTPVSAYQSSPATSTPSNSGNAMPGYPLHQAPQTLIQSSHNSSGYPGQEMTSGIGESSVPSPQHWNANASNNHINNHQQNNAAGSAGVNGNTNASANRSVWNGSNPEQSSPLRQESSPQQQSNNTSPASYGSQQQSPQERTNLNSRLKTMILNKQQMQQQYNQQMQYQVYNHQMQIHSPHPDSGQSPDPKQQEQMQQDQEQEQQEQQFMIGHLTPHNGHAESHESNSQNLAGNFLVQGHHLRELTPPEGGGQWAWSSEGAAEGAAGADISTVLDSSKNGLNPEEVADNNTPSGFSDRKCTQQERQGQQKHDYDWLPQTYQKYEQVNFETKGHEFYGWTQDKEKVGDGNGSQQTDAKVKREEDTDYYPLPNTENSQTCMGTRGPWGQGPWSGTDHLIDGVHKSKTSCDITAQYQPSWDQEPWKEGVDENSKEHLERLRHNVRTEVPDCSCFPPDKFPPEPGSYYTHLGAASSLPNIRTQVEARSGFKGNAVRIEKVVYTGKEGKTTQGCPLAKWVIRRSGTDEKILVIVKNRQGHECTTAWIIVAMVAWEGVPSSEADHCYTLLSHKLNRFGLPTTRRCATNEPRTCACQGLDPNTCGASFSFGCSWSMYYNGCKYARSKTVRKFRLSVKSEEQEVEERMNTLSTLLSPLYRSLVPEAFLNQTQFEHEARDCRLGYKTGSPFSGVTACIDFCAHTHRDLHNMNNGCTVVVSLTKHRSLSKAEDEQLHVLPLYVMDDSDEFGSHETQLAKSQSGAIETLTKFPCEVRMRSVPLQPCRKHGKKRKDEHQLLTPKKENLPNVTSQGIPGCDMRTFQMEYPGTQLQSPQVTSTVVDSSVSMYRGWNYGQGGDTEWNRTLWTPESRRKQCEWAQLSVWTDNQTGNGVLEGQTEEKDPDSTTAPVTPIVGAPSISRPTQMPSCPIQFKTSPDLLHHWKNHPKQSDLATEPAQHWESVKTTAFQPISQPTEISMANLKCASSLKVPNASPLKSVEKGGSSKPGTFNDERKIDSFYPKSVERGEPGGASESLMLRSVVVKQENEQKFSNLSPYCETEAYSYRNYSECSSLSDSKEYGGWSEGYANHHFQGGSVNSFYGNFGNSEEVQACYTASPYGLSTKPLPCGYFSTVEPPRINYQRWDMYSSPPTVPAVAENPKSEPIGQVTDFVENEESFKDSHMGGVAIALGHGSVLFECAKHEMHSTTALRRPDRSQPTRISLVFYQHRNLNRPKHGWDEWEEKMRRRKQGISSTHTAEPRSPRPRSEYDGTGTPGPADRSSTDSSQYLMRTPTYTTTTWTTLFPMHPCMMTGPLLTWRGSPERGAP